MEGLPFLVKLLFMILTAFKAPTIDPMVKQGVVPDMIPVAPKHILRVTYPSGAKVNLRNELTPTQVKDQPSITFKAKANSLYTLALHDPDVPSRKEPTSREFQHWLVVNIPGSDVSKGEVISDFIGAGPPKDTGLHRYVFLVYEQPGRLSVTEPRSSKHNIKHRPGVKVKEFADKYNLGQPIAGNFFLAQWDDYVPTLYEQFTET